jgi:beta-glucosidase
MTFPTDFLWGAATSAYQVEGAVTEDGRTPSIWDVFAATPGKTHRGETGLVAADHYRRMDEDVALMAELGLNAYRFSIAWPRIIPEGTGAVNQRGLDFYDRLVDALLAHGITPLATLFHWDLPLALEERGGWRNRATAYAFADYAEVVARRLGDRVPWWVTLNEPWCAAYLGHGSGLHAPGLHDAQAAADAGHHLLLSHGLAMPRLRAHVAAGAQLGICLNIYPIYAADDRPETLRDVERADRFQNRWFLDPLFRGHYPDGLFEDMEAAPPPIEDGDLAIINAPLDVLAVNYYNRLVVRARGEDAELPGVAPVGYEHVSHLPDASYTAMGWEVYPQGLRAVLDRIHNDYAPAGLIVAENGAAYDDEWGDDGSIHDRERMEYLREHTRLLAEVLAQGVPLRGYFVWSLLDNFEWAEGYGKRFGLIYVDFATQRRTVKDSGRWYASFIAAQRSGHT